MSEVTLYYTIMSPPSRCILTVAEAIGLDLEKKNVDLFKGEHLTPEYLKVNESCTKSQQRLISQQFICRSIHNIQFL